MSDTTQPPLTRSTWHAMGDLVACDEKCAALTEPQTIEELKVALTHWREHSFHGGCSHGC